MENKKENLNESVHNVQNNASEKRIMMIIGVIILMVMCSVTSFIGGRLTKTNPFGTNIYEAAQIGDKTADNSASTDMFWTVWNTLKQNYVDPAKSDSKVMMDGAIKGMVNSYGDAATLYFNSEETKKFNDQNSGKFFEGIGAELGYRDGVIIVVAPIAGSPAEKAGIQPGDVILKVDGKELKSTDTVYDAVAVIRGDAGTTVTLNIFRKGEQSARDIAIIRGAITLPSISVKKPSEIDAKYASMDRSVVVLNVSRFTDSSLVDWENTWNSAVKQIADKGYKTVILDLRNNPGGFFDAAIYAAGEFLPKGTLVSKQQDKSGNIEEFKVDRNGKLLNVKVVVLVNSGSASASEILAGALKQSNRAKVIGENTYGKGTAQSVIDFTDGSSLHVTIRKWLLPNGEWLNHDNPIKPDIEVKRTDEDFKKGLDPQFDKAMTE